VGTLFTMTTKRCSWASADNPLLVEYHDGEWGVPVHKDRKHFEVLVLSGAQAGLSWSGGWPGLFLCYALPQMRLPRPLRFSKGGDFRLPAGHSGEHHLVRTFVVPFEDREGWCKLSCGGTGVGALG